MVLKFLLTNYLTLNPFKIIIRLRFSFVNIQFELISDYLVLLRMFST